MPRMARVVSPGLPHHITQRGVRRFNVFLEEADYLRYLELLACYSRRFGLGILSYCLMTNHTHVVGVPEKADSIAKTFRDCHGTYAAEFNKKYGKCGHVWQARPYSCVLDEYHTWAAIRYVERNPVRAGMVVRAEDYPWSSAPVHCGFDSSALLMSVENQSLEVENWSAWLAGNDDTEKEKRLRARTHSGRPCGDQDFVKRMEKLTGLPLLPRKPGPKPRVVQAEEQVSLWSREENRH